MIDRRRACWGVLMRVTPTSQWCCYGPATHREALEFRKRTVGTGIERQVVQLIPMPAVKQSDAASQADQKEKT